MTRVAKGRHSADISGEDSVVLFLIGMRINHLWQVWKWVPIVKAMVTMLAELAKAPDLGLLGRPRTFLSGRVILVQQYWKSFDHLDHYARSPDQAHLPQWRKFNRKVRDNGAVGIFHETYRIREGGAETVYANMPVFGLAAATVHVPAGRSVLITGYPIPT